jgi:patatin-like phospholipase/acyl hydrolase
MREPVLEHRTLELAVKERFKDQLFGDATTRLVIPAFMMPKTEIAVFKTDHHPDFQKDWETPAWQVARATSAAPTYLKGQEDAESGRIFIDGGVWANNPIMVALVEVLSTYQLDPDQIEILSIGTGNPPFALTPNRVFGGLWNWREVIKAAMFLTTDNATAQAGLLLGADKIMRLEPIGSAATVELDDYDRAMGELPRLARLHFSERRAELERFFRARALPRERHYSG